jgi:protein-arginine kinase activator protein McsA
MVRVYQRELSDNFNGTRFVFKIHHLPINIKELKILLEEAIEIEHYEKCAQIRDLLIQ